LVPLFTFSSIIYAVIEKKETFALLRPRANVHPKMK